MAKVMAVFVDGSTSTVGSGKGRPKVVKGCIRTAKEGYRLIPDFMDAYAPIVPEVAPKTQSRKYTLRVDGSLQDDGVRGRGKSPVGYSKVESDTVIDGVNLNGHWLKRDV